MVARVKRETGGLIVTFFRDGEEPDEMRASDSQRAAAAAITAIAARLKLYPGDTITVRREDEPGEQPELPETSRASHVSG
jgi:hypothetical protein